MKKTILGLLLTMLLALMPSAFAEEKEYTYTIQDMYFSDLSGNPISEVNNSCLVNVIVSKNAYRPNLDSIVIASYATDGEFIGFSMMRGSTSVGTDTQFATLVRPPEGKKIGKVKAYVWNNISEMVPLSKTSEIIVNEMTNEPQEQEKYIPDYFEICAVLEETPQYGNLDSNQYILSGVSGLYDYSDCYTAEQYNKKKERYDAIYEYYGIAEYNDIMVLSDDDLNEYIFQYLKVTIKVDEYGNYVVKNVTPVAGTNSVTLDLALVDDDKYTATEIMEGLEDSNPYIYIYASEEAVRSTKYNLERNFRLLVNGVEVDNYDDNLEKYIVNNTVGNIKLIDTYKSEDGYDIVSVEYFDTTRVNSTSTKNIYIQKNTDGLNTTSLSRDSEYLEDNEIVMNVYLNGEKVNASEIKKDDIISIKYNVNECSYSSFFDIYISRDTAQGKFTGKDTEDKIVTIGGVKYGFVDWTIGNAEFSTSKMGNEFKVFLDVFGRIYTQEEATSAANYAIALRWVYQQSDWDNDGVRLYFTDGTYKNVEFASNVKVEGSVASTLSKLETAVKAAADKGTIMDRVVKYTINTQNKISKIELLAAPSMKSADFDSRNSKIGNIVMNSATTIINASGFDDAVKDLSVANIDMLVNGAEYEAYAYGTPSTTDNAYPFVLITAGTGTYTQHTSFAVVTKDMYPSIKDDGEEGQMLEVLYEGSEEVQALFVDEDAVYDEAVAGDVVVLQKDADGDVKEVKVIFSNKDFGTEDFVDALGNFNEDITLPSEDWDTAWISEKDMETSLVFGPIVKRNNRKFLAQVDSDNKTFFDKDATKGATTSEGAILDIITTDDTNVYVYDINKPRIERFYVGTTDDIITTQVNHLTYLEGDYYTIDWSAKADDDQINFAFAKLVDGVVTDIFVIIGIGETYEEEPEPEPEISVSRYAIALKWVQQSAWDNDGMRLYFTDGTYKNIEFASNVKIEGSVANTLTELKNELMYATDRYNIMERVVKYTINTQNKISKIELLAAPSKKTADYDERNTKIGNIYMNSDTKIIDASEFEYAVKDLAVANIDMLINDVEYEAYAYGTPSTTDYAYPFVLITSGTGTYTQHTSFAVVTKDMYPSIKDDGEEGQMLEVLYEGSEEVQALFVDEDAWYDEACAGDVVVFQKKADGDLKEVKVIFSNYDFGTESFVDALGNFAEDITLPSEDWDTAWISEKDMETSLVFGPIVERNNRKFLAQVKNDKTYFDLEATKGTAASEGATLDIITTADTNVYVYDINAARNNRFYVGTVDDIVATQVEHLTYLEGDYYTIDWSYAEYEDQINFAFAKLVDGVVTDIFVIVGVE